MVKVVGEEPQTQLGISRGSGLLAMTKWPYYMVCATCMAGLPSLKLPVGFEGSYARRSPLMGLPSGRIQKKTELQLRMGKTGSDF